MASPQLNVRLPADDDDELTRWAAERGIEKGALARDIFREAIAARRGGRAMFDHPAQPEPQDMQHLATEVRALTIELDRVLRQAAKRDAELARQARIDTHGINEAHRAIVDAVVAHTTDKFHELVEPLRASMADLHNAQANAAGISSAIASLADALSRIENDERLDRIAALQAAHTAAHHQHTAAINDNTAAYEQLAREPRTVTRFELGNHDWSGRKLCLVIVISWFMSLGTIFPIAKLLPSSWFAVPIASGMMGGRENAVYELER